MEIQVHRKPIKSGKNGLQKDLDPPGRKRRTDGDEEQQASPNPLVPKRKRPAAPRSCLGNEMAQRNDKGNEEGRLGLLLNNDCLQRQLSQLREEMRMSRSWMRNVMQESREKDKKIMQLKVAMSPGEQTSNYDSGTINVGGGNPIAVKPSSLDGSGMKSDPPQSGADGIFQFANLTSPAH